MANGNWPKAGKRAGRSTFYSMTMAGEAPESTPCPTLTTLPVFLKHSLLVLDTYEAAVHVYRGLSADGV